MWAVPLVCGSICELTGASSSRSSVERKSAEAEQLRGSSLEMKSRLLKAVSEAHGAVEAAVRCLVQACCFGSGCRSVTTENRWFSDASRLPEEAKVAGTPVSRAARGSSGAVTAADREDQESAEVTRGPDHVARPLHRRGQLRKPRHQARRGLGR